MNREYHKWFSPRLGRDMELLIFGHAGLPVLVFPTSSGRFFEFEDRQMVAAVGGKIDNGEIQLYCLDTVDSESWYNRDVPPRWKIARHLQYEDYILNEVMPLLAEKNWNPLRATLGSSFGGYHAVNLALRHPEIFSGFLAMSGAFDVSNFLRGYYDEDCYFNLPTHYIPNIHDHALLERYRRNTYILATGYDDQCLGSNRHLASLMHAKGVPCRLEIWDTFNSHDWPTWQKMVQTYL